MQLDRLEEKLSKRRGDGNSREPLCREGLIDFCSNDYLGMARSKQLLVEVVKAWRMIEGELTGLGSTGSRLLTGQTHFCHKLEEEIARFHDFQAGVIFNCGYMANMGLLSAIPQEGDLLLFDAHIHASVHEGIRLSSAYGFPFRHNDLAHLEKRLQSLKSRSECFILVESIYSTDGSRAPLKAMVELAEQYHAHLIVDEAHAVGVYGAKGEGIVFAEKLQERIFASVVTFGKALGVQGAIVLSSHAVRQYLINYATSWIYTTALPLINLISIQKAYRLLPQLDRERRALHGLMRDAPFGTTHIQSYPITGNREAHALSQRLAERGFDLRPLLSPTVRRGEERLRIALHAHNTPEELLELVEALC